MGIKDTFETERFCVIHLSFVTLFTINFTSLSRFCLMFIMHKAWWSASHNEGSFNLTKVIKNPEKTFEMKETQLYLCATCF